MIRHSGLCVGASASLLPGPAPASRLVTCAIGVTLVHVCQGGAQPAQTPSQPQAPPGEAAPAAALSVACGRLSMRGCNVQLGAGGGGGGGGGVGIWVGPGCGLELRHSHMCGTAQVGILVSGVRTHMSWDGTGINSRGLRGRW